MAITPKSYYDEDEDESPKKGRDAKEATALLPKTVLGGKDVTVGDRITLEITSIHDDQIAVAYAQKDQAPKPDKPAEDGEEAEVEPLAPPDESGEEVPQEADLYA